MRKNEFSRLDVRFVGRHFHPNGKEVRRFYSITDYAKFVEEEIKNLKEFKETLIDLSGASSKYQMVGIHQLVKKTISNTDFFHFELGFIYREQEKLETYDTKSDKIEHLVIDGTKYRHIRLHFTLVPHNNLIILDNKCHSSATNILLKEVFSKYINSAEYNSIDDAKQNLRVKITPIPKDDFEQILNQKFRNLKEVSLLLAKPSKLKTSSLPDDLDVDLEDEKFASVVESLMGSVLGISKDEIIVDSLPVKSIRFSIKFDDNSTNGILRSNAKNNAKNFLKEYRNNLYTDEASFKYKDTDGELEQALLNSAKLTDDSKVDPNNYHNSDKMWEEQRRSYKYMKSKQLI